ncbi:MAG: hypothetical protein D6675_03365 [Gemmatimonadetes bacterium]|nr:MAG: hypothetical protein D6675_03365 [Gemmatimonadota bacterium]
MWRRWYVCLLLLAGWVTAAPTQQIYLYEHPEYQGNRLVLDANTYWYDLAQLHWNDTISSIQIDPGVDVTVYADPRFEGHSITFHESVPDLRWIRDDPANTSWDNRISSLTVGQPDGTPEAVVIFYDAAYYRGESLAVGDGATLYDLAQTGWNDRISAVRVAEGYEVTLYEDAQLGGPSITLRHDAPNLRYIRENTASTWNDRVSSFRVRRIAPPDAPPSVRIYEHAYYQGDALELDVPSALADLSQIGWNQRISSLKISPGTTVILYEFPNFKGRRVELTANTIDLTKVFKDRPQSWNDFAASLRVIHPQPDLKTDSPPPHQL